MDNQASDGSRSANSLRHSAPPGKVVVLSGTGLGSSRPEVWVGLQRATVVAARRGTLAQADEIAFRLPPASPAGCFVPLQVRQAGAAPSNTVTVSIHSSGEPCEPSAILPIAAWSGHTAGLVAISRTVKAPDSTAGYGMAVFARREDQDPALSQVLLIPPLGTCTTFTGAMAPGSQPSFSLGDAPLASAHATALDAGPRITVAHSNSNLLRPLSPILGAPGFYERLLGAQRGGRPGRNGPLFLDPGNLVAAGEGGTDVGPFAVPLPAPEPFVWENRDGISTVDRRLGVTLRWRPLSQEGVALIGLTSVDPSATAWGACYCAAAGASGTFTIPPAILASLPASQAGPAVPAPSLWLSYVPFRNQQPLRASGLDNGLAISLFMQALEVVVR